MPIRAYTFKDENSLARFMTERGISHHEVGGPYYNMNGAQFILVDEGAAASVPPSGIPSVGISVGTTDGGTPNQATATDAYSSATAESLGAAAIAFTATLSNTVVIPNSVVITMTGSATSLKDNGRGKLVNVADASPRGTIDYYTGAVAITFWPQDQIGGTVEADYLYSTLPNATGMPDKVELVGLSIANGTGSATVEVAVYNDSSLTSLAVAGGTTLDSGGNGFVSLQGAISIAVDPTIPARWVVISGSDNYDVVLQWRRADM